MKKLFELIKREAEENWKYTNENYLFELQKFLDIAENIEDEYLQNIVINQMLKCDKSLTIVAEEMFENIKSKKVYKI